MLRNIINGEHVLTKDRLILSVIRHKKYPHAFLLIEGLDEKEIPIRKRAGLVYRVRDPKRSDPVHAEIDYFDVAEDKVWSLHQDEDNYVCKIVVLTPEEKLKLEEKIAADQKNDRLEQEPSSGIQQRGKLDSLTWAEQAVTHIRPGFDFRNNFGRFQVVVDPPDGSFLQLWNKLFYIWNVPDKESAATLAVIDYLTLAVPLALTFVGIFLVTWALPHNLSEEQPEPFTGINVLKFILISPLVLCCGMAFLLRMALVVVGVILTLPFVGVVRLFESMHRKKDSAINWKDSFFSTLNPFRGIFETNKYFHARTMRTSFLLKLSDTFFAFSGSTLRRKKEHRGIFDYATLMVPYGITCLALWLNSFDHPVATLIAFPFMLISLSIDTLRYTGAAVFTLTFSPLVGLIQIGSKYMSDSIKDLAMSLKLKKYNKYEFNGTLNDFLNDNTSSLQDLRVSVKGTYDKLTLIFRKKSQNVMAHRDCMYESQRDNTAITTLNLNKDIDRSIFDALLKLNVGKIARKLERMNVPAVFFRSPNTLENIKIPLISDQQRMEAFCQGLHPGLGAKSQVFRFFGEEKKGVPYDPLGERELIGMIKTYL
jgi:hypothetical protein